MPHDFGIEHAFDPSLDHLMGCLRTTGAGWYRARFGLPEEGRALVASGGRVFFDCDGAMAYPLVWVNGRFAGGWCYGYTPFRVDLTPFLDPDGENVLAVRTYNPPQSSRWYTGAGLYRECRLVVEPADHVVFGSVAIATPEVTRDRATVRATWEMSLSGKRERILTVENPRLWDVDDPYLYSLEIEGHTYRYGIRSISFHADERGFQLNGRRVQLRGMCLHHDFGALGAAWNAQAARRRLSLLKETGCNAIRMTHNAPASQLLDLCDEMGFLVMDEVFDQWALPKNPNDYWKLWPKWHEADLRAWVRSGRNHPSVIIWGIGNEITESRTARERWPAFSAICDELRAIVREEDPARRPVCTAADNAAVALESEAPRHLDLWGANYKAPLYPKLRAALPGIPLFGSETCCILSTRGEYHFPAHREDGSTHLSPYLDFHASSYGWSGDYPPDEEWARQEETPSVMGDFSWTGFDYLGGPYSMWKVRRAPRYSDPERAAAAEAEIARDGVCRDNMHSCPTGVFDSAGFPKDLFWLYRSKWRSDMPCAHILPHWNWPGRIGQVTPVYVYSSGDEVELFLNGRSLGRKRREPGLWRFVWSDVVYEPGELRAVAYKAGALWCEETVRTAGAPVRLALESESASAAQPLAALALAAGRSPSPSCAAGAAAQPRHCGIHFLTCRVLDARGDTVPRTRIPVRIEVSGCGEFVAADNGDETDMEWYRSPVRKAFNGLLSIIVRAKPDASDPIRVRVSADGLESAEINFPIAIDGNRQPAGVRRLPTNPSISMQHSFPFSPDPALKFGCGRYRQEERLLENCAEEVASFGRRPLFVCDATSRSIAWEKVSASLHAAGMEPRLLVHDGFCNLDDAQARADEGALDGIDVVIGCGGGVVIDFAKCLADLAGAPVVAMPTSSAQCCAFTPIAVCYTREGRYFKTALFRREIAAALLDMTVLSRQPRRLLVAGALDAMAKKIEIEFWNALDDGGPGGERAGQPVPTLLAASISDLVYAQLDRDLDAAVADLSKGEPTPVLRDVVFSSIVGAGIVSGISGGKRQTALAHRFYFFMRARHPARAASLTHGELVAIGLVLQLAYYGRFGEAEALAARLRGWGLAASMADLGLPHDEADADACFDFLAATREMKAAGEAALPRLRQALPILF